MVYDYNVWNEAGFDFWSEEPSEALCAFIECLIQFPGTVPLIAQYDVGLDAAGYRTTITDHWTRLTWQKLLDLAVPLTTSTLTSTMDLTTIITETLTAAKTDVPDFLLAFDRGCLVVTACLERSTPLGTSDLEEYEAEEYEADDTYDHYANFSFDGAESRELAWKHASATYKAFLAKDNLYNAGLSFILDSTDHPGILS